MIKRFSIIKRTYLWLTIGLALFLGALFLFFTNLRFSEEFTGGVKLTITNSQKNENISNLLSSYLKDKKYENTNVLVEQYGQDTIISIKTKVESDEKVNDLSNQTKDFLLNNKIIDSTEQILSQTVTGPSVGNYMQSTAKTAIIFGLILMSIYMIFSFAAVRNVISPSILAFVTVVTMFFDIAIPAGAYGFLMMINNSASIDTVFIIAILTNMGYSINDTIIVFDRIRENMQKNNEKGTVYGKLFDDSLRQTMRRSFGTVFSTLLVVVAMYVLGSGAIKDFAFTVGIGIIAGSYSSIFISSPLAYLLMGRYKKEKRQGKINKK